MIERLTRPPRNAPIEHRRLYFAKLAEALKKLGVEPGEDFLVSSAKNGQRTLQHHDENRSGAVRSDASVTSRKAALDVAPRTGTQRHRILSLIVTASREVRAGITRDEVSQETGMPSQSATARIKELLDGHFIRETDVTRKTRNSSDAAVLQATQKGEDAIYGSSTEQSKGGEMETPQETPQEQPGETPAEQPQETPGDAPADTPAEQPGDAPAETPGE